MHCIHSTHYISTYVHVYHHSCVYVYLPLLLRWRFEGEKIIRKHTTAIRNMCLCLWEISLNFHISSEREKHDLFAESSNLLCYSLYAYRLHRIFGYYLLKWSKQMKDLSDSMFCWILIIAMYLLFFRNFVNQLLDTVIYT